MESVSGTEERLCRRCRRPVVVYADQYEHVFERMHYVCFHYEYEHEGDLDEECWAGGCPSQTVNPRPERRRPGGELHREG